MPNLTVGEQGLIGGAATLDACAIEILTAYARIVGGAAPVFDANDLNIIDIALQAKCLAAGANDGTAMGVATLDDLNGFVGNHHHALIRHVPEIGDSICTYAVTLVPGLTAEQIENSLANHANLRLLGANIVPLVHALRAQGTALINAANSEELGNLATKTNIMATGGAQAALDLRAHNLIAAAAIAPDNGALLSRVVNNIPAVVFTRHPDEARNIFDANSATGKHLNAEQLKKISGVHGADLPNAQLAADFVQQKGTIDHNSSQALIDAVRQRNLKRK